MAAATAAEQQSSSHTASASTEASAGGASAQQPPYAPHFRVHQRKGLLVSTDGVNGEGGLEADCYPVIGQNFYPSSGLRQQDTAQQFVTRFVSVHFKNKHLQTTGGS